MPPLFNLNNHLPLSITTPPFFTYKCVLKGFHHSFSFHFILPQSPRGERSNVVHLNFLKPAIPSFLLFYSWEETNPLLSIYLTVKNLGIISLQ